MKNILREITKSEILENRANIQRQKLGRLLVQYIDFSDFGETEVDAKTYVDSISVEMSTDGLLFVDMFSRNIHLGGVYSIIKNRGSISYAEFISYSL